MIGRQGVDLQKRWGSPYCAVLHINPSTAMSKEWTCKKDGGHHAVLCCAVFQETQVQQCQTSGIAKEDGGHPDDL